MHGDRYFDYLNEVLQCANRILYAYMRGLLPDGHTQPEPGSIVIPMPPDEDFPLCRLISLYHLSDFQVYCLALSLLYEARPDYAAVFMAACGKNVPDLALAKVSYEYVHGEIEIRDLFRGWDDETISQLLFSEAALFDTKLILQKRIYAYLLGEESHVDSQYSHIFTVVGEAQPLPENREVYAQQLSRALQKRESGREYFFFITGRPGSGRRTFLSSVMQRLGKKTVLVKLSSLAYDNETLLLTQIAAIKRECLLQDALPIVADLEYLLQKSNIPNCASVAAQFANALLPLSGAVFFITENELHWGEAVSVYITLDGTGNQNADPLGSEVLKTKAGLIAPCFEIDDLILPEKQKWLLEHICHTVSSKKEVYEQWGFGRRIPYGRGVVVLFAGPPGTGKTMAAQVLSKKLGMPLYKIDLAQIVSKYIGETEENLRVIFDEAEKSNIILMIDEMDALFGKRTKTKDSHDRYANMETSYLLQRIESYEGIVVMATNLLKNIDDAFMRRISFILHFPFPSSDIRKKIWRSLTSELPVDAGVDFDMYAEKFEISGGLIKNVVLKAAFLAAAENRPLNNSHIDNSMKNELSKQGKIILHGDFL